MPEKVFDGGLLPGPVTIGIDQSLTGFAITAVNVDNLNQYESWVYKSPYSGVQRLIDIQDWMWAKFEYLDENGNSIIDIAMEGTVLQSFSALKLGELSATVKVNLWAWGNFVKNETLKTPLQVPPMTLKKFASGKGTAKKQEMLMQIYKRYGVEFNDDNAADSYALARLASGKGIDAIEKAIIEQIKDPKFRDTII